MINWREWNEAAFQDSRREEKPVLLTLSATWCHWCHVLDQTSYSDSRVIGLVNSRFIPVRVDVDQRPDISHRYNQGGFPSVAVLNGNAELIAGCVYAPPDELAQFLERADKLFPDAPLDGSQFQEDPHPSLPQSQSGTEPATDRVLRKLEELYDRDFGGFGREPKQPPWEALRFLLALHSRSGDRKLLKMVVDTLESMRAGLYDLKDQGFFRYSVSRDWRVPHYEKMLVTNASLACVYLEAYQVTRRTAFRDTAVGALKYLMEVLYDRPRGLFRASQDAGERYYHSPWKDRETMERPAVDPTFYTGWNGLVAGALIKASGVLGTSSYLQTATRVLEILWQECWSPDLGMTHLVGGLRQSASALEDDLHPLLAFLALHQATGRADHLQNAVAIAQSIIQRFGDPSAGFHDLAVGGSATDQLLAGEKSVLENSLLAEALFTLHCLTGEERYVQLGRDALEVFQDVAPGSSYLGPRGSRRMEEDEERLFLPAGAAWGRAWDMLNHGPVHLVLVGPSGQAKTRRLLHSAHRLYAPHRVIQLLDPDQDADRINSLGFPLKKDPALYLCFGAQCMAPISTAKEMMELRTLPPWRASNNLGP